MTLGTSSVYLSLAEIAKRIPSSKDGRPVHTSTVSRWITKGARANSGSFVKLGAKRFPGGWKVTDEALEEFLERLTAQSLGQNDAASTVHTSASRREDLKQAAGEWESLAPV